MQPISALTNFSRQVSSAPGWSRRPTVTADDLPLHQQVFVLWLQLLIQRRAAAGAAAVS